MNVKTVPIRESLSRGWDLFKENAVFIVVVFVAASIVYAIAERADEMAERFIWPAELMVSIGYLIAITIVEIGLISVTLKLVDTAKSHFDHLVSEMHVLFKYLIAMLLYGLMVGLGFVVLIVPGIYLAIKFGFFGFFIVDDKLEPLDAFRASSRLTDGVKLDLFLFYLTLILVMFVGLLLLVVGIYVAWPVARLATAYVYRSLRAQSDGTAADTAAAV